MKTFTLNLIANTECEMASLKQAAVSEFIRMADKQVGCSPTEPRPQLAGITISLECWRDENNKLHCRLSVSLSAA